MTKQKRLSISLRWGELKSLSLTVAFRGKVHIFLVGSGLCGRRPFRTLREKRLAWKLIPWALRGNCSYSLHWMFASLVYCSQIDWSR
jgi:hypothetical protein